MAYYTPPPAPRQGQMTVDSSRFQAPAPTPIPDPFQKAYDIKKQAMDMKRLERAEKEAVSSEVAAVMQNDIFALSDAHIRDFNPDNILQGGVFNAAEIEKRKFTSELKAATWKKYQSNAKKAGGVADRQTFETAWGQGKAKEDDKILNEMWMDVQSNRMSDKEFGLATRNEAFRNMWKDVTGAQKQQFQEQLEAAGMDKYNPGYETFWEKHTGTAPGDDASDMAKSTLAKIGYAVVPGGGLLMSPTVRKAVTAPVVGAYNYATGGNMTNYKAEVGKVHTLRQKARALGFDHKTGKAGTGKAFHKSEVYVDRKNVIDFTRGSEGKALKNLEAKAKAGTLSNVDNKRLEELTRKRDALLEKRADSGKRMENARKELNRQKRKVADLKTKLRGGGPAGGQAPGGKAPKANLGKYFKGTGGALMKGATGGMFAGYITGAGSRMLLGEDSKGARLTNEAMETIGTQAGMGSGQIAMMKKIKNAISKKGYKWALKKVAQKGGLKLAMSVGAKAILGTAGGVVSGGALTAVSAGLLAKDLYDIAQILSE